MAGHGGSPGQFGFAGDGSLARTARLFHPSGLALGTDPEGSDPALFFADTGSHRVRRVDGLYGTAPSVHTVLGDGAPASSGEGGPARLLPVHAPAGIDVDRAGNLYTTSLDALRVVFAGDERRAGGAGRVSSIYGAPPRATFPEPITTCLQQVRVAPSGYSIYAIDECQGLLLELVRSTEP